MTGFIGSGNIDTNSRLCMASSVAGHIRALGEDIVPTDKPDARRQEQSEFDLGGIHRARRARQYRCRPRRPSRAV
jgi:assimilatory nitrate reductase catalytic subunit